MQMLTRLELHGFKSIRHLAGLDLGPLNVLIGANGAGKSNLISFFKLLNWMTTAPGNLQLYVGKLGGGNALLYDGAFVTPQILSKLTFRSEISVSEYDMRLFHAAPDTLIFADERFRTGDSFLGQLIRNGFAAQASWRRLGSGHRETRLIEYADSGDNTARVLLSMMRRCIVYQFHNTSETARVRQRWRVDDNRWLKDDAANLAPFLLRLRESQPREYARIADTIRQIVPFFADFVLDPLDGTVLLQWRELASDMVFGPQLASDGTLRTMSLVALLLQPEADLPEVMILDEPELGLHPFAIAVIAGLLRSVATHTQVILATQSMSLIDHFDPEQIVVVDRIDRESTFRRLEPEKLEEWLAEYSVSELWEKNVLGGRPHR